MSVLVTGGAGYIGSHMVLELLDAGEQPVVLDNLSTGFRWAVPEGVPLIIGDFGDRALVDQVIADHNVTAIIHFAAKIVVPESVADPLSYYENNTAKARCLIACAVKGGIKHFIFSSTAAVYGEPKANPVTENEPLAPVSPYGRSKLMVEWMLADVAAAHDLSYTALRYFNVAGADPKGRSGQSTPNATHLIKVAVQAALGRRPGMDVFGTDYPTPDGSCLRDYIHVTDLVRAHMDALRRLRACAVSRRADIHAGRRRPPGHCHGPAAPPAAPHHPAASDNASSENSATDPAADHGCHSRARRAHPQPEEHRHRPAARAAGGDHRPVGLGQELAGLRHAVCGGPAPLRGIAVGLRAAVPATDGEARR
jgi:UDP-glucose 4-epimerase